MTQTHVVDGTNLIFRYWHGIPPKTLYTVGRHQVFNNVLYGWFNQLVRWANDNTVDLSRMVVVFDGPGCMIREFYPDYKANRGEKPVGFREQVALVIRMTRWLGIRVVQSPDEADPAIVYLARWYASEGGLARMVSSDKDLMQAVGGHITMLRPEAKGSRFKVFGEAEVVEKMGVLPRLIPQLLALMGDDADNVPGVYGIGQKTAASLLNRYGSLRNIVESRMQLPKGQRTKLEEALPALATYLKVVKIVPLPVAIPDPQTPSASAFMRACGMLGLLKQLEELMELGMI